MVGGMDPYGARGVYGGGGGYGGGGEDTGAEMPTEGAAAEAAGEEAEAEVVGEAAEGSGGMTSRAALASSSSGGCLTASPIGRLRNFSAGTASAA